MNRNELMSQNELNLQAQTNAEAARKKVNEIYRQLSAVLNDKERRLLEASQKAWEVYSIKHAEFSAARYENASLYPLTYFDALEQLANQRIGILEAELKEKNP